MPVNPNAPPTQPPVEETPPPTQGDATDVPPAEAQDIPQAFLNTLAEAGLYIDPDDPTKVTSFDPEKMADLQQAVEDAKGKAAKKKALAAYTALFRKAVARPNAKQLAAMQKAYNRFGLANDDYDTSLVYMTADGVGVDLRTGKTGDGGSLSDAELEALRNKAGYDPEYAYQAYVEANTFKRGDGSVYTSYAARPENRAIYERGAAASRLYAQGLSIGDVAAGLLEGGFITQDYYDKAQAQTQGFLTAAERSPTPEGTAPIQGEGSSFLGGFDFDSVSTQDLSGAATSLQQMLTARQARERSTQATTGEFFGVDELLFPQDEE